MQTVGLARKISPRGRQSVPENRDQRQGPPGAQGKRQTGGRQEITVRRIAQDPLLEPYRERLDERIRRVAEMEKRLTGGRTSLADFASGHEYFGLHRLEGEWVLREWAPNATRIYLVGTMTGWQERDAFALQRPEGAEGVWEIRLPPDALSHGDLYRLRVHWTGRQGDRIPAYARRVVQDHDTLIFNAQVWAPPRTLPLAAAKDPGVRRSLRSSTRPTWAWPRRRRASARTGNSRSCTPAAHRPRRLQRRSSSWPSRSIRTTAPSATR